MTVGELIQHLNMFTNETEIVVDHDSNGFYSLDVVEPSHSENGKEEFVNLISSNES